MQFFSTHCAKNDAESVNIIVEKLAQEVHNPILLYKPQGQCSGSHGKDTFILALQTKFQQAMLAKHGERFLCIDATHGLTGVDFQLVTIMVVDEFRHGKMYNTQKHLSIMHIFPFRQLYLPSFTDGFSAMKF